MFEKYKKNCHYFADQVQPYLFPWIYLNGTLLVGHPAERLKVAAQLHLNQPSWVAMKPLLANDVRHLFTGFPTCSIRQNFKYTYRSITMCIMPDRVDAYQFNPFLGSAIKAAISCGIDTFMVTPFENVKTWQMKAETEKLTIANAATTILNQRGFAGFFAGYQATAAKSFPSWYYLFLGYEATKDKREKHDFLQTIFWATLTAIPVTLTTNPLDVIKTQQQAALIPETEKSLLKAAQFIVKQHGLFSLAKGMSCRLLHKSLATAAGYTIMDLSTKLTPK